MLSNESSKLYEHSPKEYLQAEHHIVGLKLSHRWEAYFLVGDPGRFGSIFDISWTMWWLHLFLRWFRSWHRIWDIFGHARSPTDQVRFRVLLVFVIFLGLSASPFIFFNHLSSSRLRFPWFTFRDHRYFCRWIFSHNSSVLVRFPWWCRNDP